MAIGFSKKNIVKEENIAEEVDDLTQKKESEKRKISMPVLMAAIVCAVVILCIIMYLLSNKKDTTLIEEKDVEEVLDDSKAEIGNEEGEEVSNGIYDADGQTLDPEGINPGAPDYDRSINSQTTERVYEASDYIKDLNGLDVSAVYNVESREYVYDYVSYETRRAITAEGMELYWLEAEYNGKPYRVQVPFYYFKDLGVSGICKVEVEVLTLVGGGKIVSYMQVIPEEGMN